MADVCAAGADAGAPGTDVSAAGVGGSSLDRLPMELLLKVASWLDLPSILRLECTSKRYRDAGPLLRRQLRVLRVGAYGDGSVTSAELLEMLPQLLELRELHVIVSRWQERSLLEALVAASRHWQKLETLDLFDPYWSEEDRPDINQLLIQLCESCSRVTYVRLVGDFSDRGLERMVAALPAVRTFRVNNQFSYRMSGSFLSQLPAELRHLFVECEETRSEAVTELRRYTELRSLELRYHGQTVQPAHLAAGLSGCGRLRRLTVDPCTLSPECLLHLPQLRHLEFGYSLLKDAHLDRLLSLLPSQLPGLESFSLRCCGHLTQEGLATGMTKLSGLCALRSLALMGIFSLCDWPLAELRSQSLQQLYLSEPALGLRLTATGLLAVVNNCGSLETLTLRVERREVRIACDSAAREQGLLEKIQTVIDIGVGTSR